VTAAHTPGPWLLATSNSWRRFESRDGLQVCEPIQQRDGHPDLHFRNGGQDGPDARLIVAAPDLLAALIVLRAEHSRIEPHHEDLCAVCQQADAAIARAGGNV
jgi:hypothetical protein